MLTKVEVIIFCFENKNIAMRVVPELFFFLLPLDLKIAIFQVLKKNIKQIISEILDMLVKEVYELNIIELYMFEKFTFWNNTKFNFISLTEQIKAIVSI